jgi:hypothetical protein
MLTADQIAMSLIIAASLQPRWVGYASIRPRRLLVFAERLLRKAKVVEESQVVPGTGGTWVVRALVHSDEQERAFRKFIGDYIQSPTDYDQLAQRIVKKSRHGKPRSP